MRNKVIPKTHKIKYNNISASSYDEKTRNQNSLFNRITIDEKNYLCIKLS